MPDIRRLDLEDLPAYRAHLERHFAESGSGEPAFAPFSKSLPVDFQRWQGLCAVQLSLPLRSPNWRRTWCLWQDESVVGHVELNGPELPVSLHRAQLGVGLERPHRRRGLGANLMQTAISWAQAQDEIDWLDLTVFAHSAPAIALYSKLGFRQVSLRQDRHRIDGESVDEVMMVLGLE